MSKNFDAYIALDKTGLENKYVIIVKGGVVVKVQESPFVAKVPCQKFGGDYDR